MTKIILASLLLSINFGVQAQVYKWVDADGRVNYSSTPPKGQKADSVDMRPAIEIKSSPRQQAYDEISRDTNKSHGKENFIPVEDINVQLDKELAEERSLLEAAKKELDEAESNPKVYQTTVDGKTVTRRNVAAFEEAVKSAKDKVEAHEANIKRLIEQKSISKIPMPPLPNSR